MQINIETRVYYFIMAQKIYFMAMNVYIQELRCVWRCVNYNLATSKRKCMQVSGGVFALTPPAPADPTLPNFNYVQICCSEGTGGHLLEFYISISAQKQYDKS